MQRQHDKTIHVTLPLEDQTSTPATYKMTIDFHHLNKVTPNDHSTQLPSVYAIDTNFSESLVSTIIIANMFPSILLEENSRNFFNLYYQDEIL